MLMNSFDMRQKKAVSSAEKAKANLILNIIKSDIQRPKEKS
jgi:hypothetical protein